MITVTSYTYEFRGLSTDDKSTIKNVTNGSVFFEMDSGKVFLYDEENKQWKELS